MGATQQVLIGGSMSSVLIVVEFDLTVGAFAISPPLAYLYGYGSSDNPFGTGLVGAIDPVVALQGNEFYLIGVLANDTGTSGEAYAIPKNDVIGNYTSAVIVVGEHPALDMVRADMGGGTYGLINQTPAAVAFSAYLLAEVGNTLPVTLTVTV